MEFGESYYQYLTKEHKIEMKDSMVTMDTMVTIVSIEHKP